MRATAERGVVKAGGAVVVAPGEHRVRLGRRKVIPAIAIQAVIDASLAGFRIEDRHSPQRPSNGPDASQV